VKRVPDEPATEKKPDGGGGGTTETKRPDGIVLPVPGVKAVEPAPEKKPDGGASKPDGVTLADDDEREDLPEDKPITLKKKNLDKRIATAKRTAKKELLAEFGTDDIEEIKKKIKLADAAAEKEEKARQESLSKEEKLQEERDAAVRERDELKTRHRRFQREVELKGEEYRVEKIASRHVDPEFSEAAVGKFVAHLAKTFDLKTKEGRKKADAMSDADVDKFFSTLVKEKPKYGLAPEERREARTKVPITNGITEDKPEQRTETTKTVLPGRANSMTKAEYNDYKRKNRIRA
jgi:hypothetical protein